MIVAGSAVVLVVVIVRLNRRWPPLGAAYAVAEEYNEALLRDMAANWTARALRGSD